MEEFGDFIASTNAGIRIGQQLKWVPVSAYCLTLLISFFGLLFAATKPDRSMPDGYLWCFAIYSLCLCPLLGYTYKSWLRFFAKQVAETWSRDTDKLFENGAYFDSIKGSRKRLEDAENDPEVLEMELAPRKAELLKTRSGRISVAVLEFLFEPFGNPRQ